MKRGYVPSEAVTTPINKLIRERWPDGGGPEILAEKIGCDSDFMRKWLKPTYPTADFDLADKVFCALGLGLWGWLGYVPEVYYGCDIRTRQEVLDSQRVVYEPKPCKCCGTIFTPSRANHHFCRDKCRVETNIVARVEPRNCVWCGTEFTPRRKEGRFCSNRCSGIHTRHKERLAIGEAA